MFFRKAVNGSMAKVVARLAKSCGKVCTGGSLAGKTNSISNLEEKKTEYIRQCFKVNGKDTNEPRNITFVFF